MTAAPAVPAAACLIVRCETRADHGCCAAACATIGASGWPVCVRRKTDDGSVSGNLSAPPSLVASIVPPLITTSESPVKSSVRTVLSAPCSVLNGHVCEPVLGPVYAGSTKYVGVGGAVQPLFAATHWPAWHVSFAPHCALVQHCTSTHDSAAWRVQHSSPVPHDAPTVLPEHTAAAAVHVPLLQTWPSSQSLSVVQPTHWLSMHCLPAPQSVATWHWPGTHAPCTQMLPAP